MNRAENANSQGPSRAGEEQKALDLLEESRGWHVHAALLLTGLGENAT